MVTTSCRKSSWVKSSSTESRSSDRKLKPLPPDPFRHQNSAIARMLGRNGVVGAGAASDGPIALNTAIAQVASSGVTIDAAVLKGLARQSEPLRTGLISHEHALAAHTQQVAACNALHE